MTPPILPQWLIYTVCMLFSCQCQVEKSTNIFPILCTLSQFCYILFSNLIPKRFALDRNYVKIHFLCYEIALRYNVLMLLFGYRCKHFCWNAFIVVCKTFINKPMMVINGMNYLSTSVLESFFVRGQQLNFSIHFYAPILWSIFPLRSFSFSCICITFRLKSLLATDRY